jgi:Acyl-CoA reductase (LuxC)
VVAATRMSTVTDARADVTSALTGESWSIERFLQQIAEAPPPGRPFASESIAFCEALSRDLLDPRHAPRYPQVISLGYWLRPASVERARESFVRLQGEGTILVPRGRVLHITPANVDTMFAYSWILALLVGNSNIVRVTTRTTDATRRILDATSLLLCDPAFDDLQRRNHIVFTGHDDRVSRQLSSVADVRVVWGGDATIEHFREFPLPARGRDVTFPNRHSLAILDADAIRRADEHELGALADHFFNDAYWFDQAACSSPRLLIWVARHADRVEDVRLRFRDAVDSAIRRRAYEAETGVVLEKMVLGLRTAAAADGIRYVRDSNEATWVELPDLAHYEREHCGGGLFFEFVTHDLEEDLVGFLDPADQTAACYGVDRNLALTLARRINGRGIDRWVRIGEALTFGSVWDGYDLLEEFARRVLVDL